MQNNGSVMNGLHKISGKIAEASRSPLSTSATTDDHRSDSPVLPPPATSVRGNSPIPAAAVSPSRTKEQTPLKTAGSLLGDALLRRYEDFLKTRRDLGARIVRESESLRIRQEELQKEAEKVRTCLEQLEKFREAAGDTDGSVDPGDQAAFAAECRKIEHIRLELFRITEQTNALSGEKSSGEKQFDTASFLLLFDSLSFSQLARAGFAFFFPLLVTLILSSLILAVAVILSFNGVFVW